MLEIGTQAPDFILTDKDGKAVSLSDFRGKKVALYFYLQDNTSGRARQARAFADACGAFQDRNAVVVGVSRDSAAFHVVVSLEAPVHPA